MSRIRSSFLAWGVLVILACTFVLALATSASGQLDLDISRWFQKVRTANLEFHGDNFAITKTTDSGDYLIDVQDGMGTTGGLGLYPCSQTMDAVAALSAAGVHAAIVLPTGATATTVETTGITSPVHYRVLSITGNDAVCTSNVVIAGTNWAGQAISETIAGNGAAKVIGNKPFKTVTSITVYGVAVPAGKTYTIGFDDKLGLYRPIAATADLVQIELKASAGTAWVITAAGVLPTGAAVSATYDTVLPETTITAVDSYKFLYNAEAW